jgi:hypothetical protein
MKEVLCRYKGFLRNHATEKAISGLFFKRYRPDCMIRWVGFSHATRALLQQ